MQKLAEKLNELIAREGTLTTELKDLKKVKSEMMNNIVANMGVAEGKGDRKAEKIVEESKRMIDEINEKIVEMLRPTDMQAPIELVFQSIEGLHNACPNHPGDWYFTGHYPTPGGNKLVNQAFVNYVDQKLK